MGDEVRRYDRKGVYVNREGEAEADKAGRVEAQPPAGSEGGAEGTFAHVGPAHGLSQMTSVKEEMKESINLMQSSSAIDVLRRPL